MYLSILTRLGPLPSARLGPSASCIRLFSAATSRRPTILIVPQLKDLKLIHCWNLQENYPAGAEGWRPQTVWLASWWQASSSRAATGSVIYHAALHSLMRYAAWGCAPDGRASLNLQCKRRQRAIRQWPQPDAMLAVAGAAA